MNTFETYSEADILRQAQALRAETIRRFVSGLFRTRTETAPAVPMHAAAAE
jgi:hypothetical protein